MGVFTVMGLPGSIPRAQDNLNYFIWSVRILGILLFIYAIILIRDEIAYFLLI